MVSTTHIDGPPGRLGGATVHVCFGRALGWMTFAPGWGELQLMDVDGAGARHTIQRPATHFTFTPNRGFFFDIDDQPSVQSKPQQSTAPFPSFSKEASQATLVPITSLNRFL